MFFGPHNMKMSHHFISLWYPLKLGTFLISKDPPPIILNFSQLKLGTFWKCEDPPPNFELFPTETWDFFDFLTTPHPYLD